MKCFALRLTLAVSVFAFAFQNIFIAQSAEAKAPKVNVAVTVTGEDGKAISGATISIEGEVRTYTATTGTDGKASLAVPFIAKGQYWVTATKRGFESKDRLVLLDATIGSGTIDAPPIILKKKAGEEEHPKIAIAVTVKGEDGQGIPGAAISMKGPEGTYNGTTDGSGKSSVTVPFIAKAEYSVDASKRDYENGSRMVILGSTLDSATVDAPPITMKKGAPRPGIRVTFNVKKADTPTIPVRGAHIKVRDMSKLLSDDYYLTTNSDGAAPVRLPGPGSYPFAVTHDAFEPQEGQVQLNPGDETKNIDIQLKEITSDKTVTVTVVAGDVKNGKGGNEPIRGATVTGGQGTGTTDSRGMATIAVKPYAVDAGDALGWAEKVDVTVSADNYKSQTKSIQLKQARIGQPWTANETFVMAAGEDELADDTPIKIIVEVTDPLGPLASATVALGGLGEQDTNSKGETKIFDSGKRSADDLARLRKGIPVKVTRRDHEVYEKTIPADLLQPSKEPRRYSVELKLDWASLGEAIASVESYVESCKAGAQAVRDKAKSIDALSAKCAAARGRAEAALAELKAAVQTANAAKTAEDCKRAVKLTGNIQKLWDEAREKEQQLRRAADDGAKLAATCKSKPEADTIRSKWKDVIRLTRELGNMEKSAREQNKELSELAKTLADTGLVSPFQEQADKIDKELIAIGKDAAEADNDFDTTTKIAQSLPGCRQEALKKFDEMRAYHYVRDYDRFIPGDLQKRLMNLEDTVGPNGTNLILANVPTIDRTRLNVVKDTVSKLQEYKNEALHTIELYKQKCDVRPLDGLVEGIGDIVVGLTAELADASNLMEKADACEKAAAAADEEVTVPDVSGYADVGAMKGAATNAGLVPALAATKATPPGGSTRLFAGQSPAANTKAKKGSTLTIMLFQQVAQATPTPSPSPSAIAKVSPSPSQSPSGDDVRVPDLSIFDGLVEMKAAASQVGLVAALAATKATPPPGATRLFAGQDPAAGSTAKKGSTVKILVYQKAAENAAASATPSASPTATSVVAKTGNMPNLIGLTIDQAVGRLPKNMRIRDVEAGDKPPVAEQARTIFSQTPAAGSNVDMSKPIVVSVKIYGGAKAEIPAANRFDGTYVGSYSGADKGRVRFSVHGGAIAITSPGSGTGQISASGRASITGSGADGASTYSFSGAFTLDASGGASAGGRWSGQQSGYKGSGTWSASRQ